MKHIVFPFENNWARAIFATGNDIQLVDIGVHDYATLEMRKNDEIVPNATFHFVISGKGHLNLSSKKYNLGPGDIFYIPPYAEKSYFPHRSMPWKYFFFTLKGTYVEQFFQKAGFSEESPIYHVEKNTQTIATEFSDMVNTLYNSKSNYTASIELLAMATLYKICALVASERNPPNRLIIHQKNYSEHIKYHLEHHFHEPDMTVTRLCSEMFFSQSYLSKLFKKENGITIQEYIAQLRINSACNFLKQTTMTVKQVAEYVGYTNVIAFSRMFKKLIGSTPSEYRENIEDREETEKDEQYEI